MFSLRHIWQPEARIVLKIQVHFQRKLEYHLDLTRLYEASSQSRHNNPHNGVSSFNFALPNFWPCDMSSRALAVENCSLAYLIWKSSLPNIKEWEHRHHWCPVHCIQNISGSVVPMASKQPSHKESPSYWLVSDWLFEELLEAKQLKSPFIRLVILEIVLLRHFKFLHTFPSEFMSFHEQFLLLLSSWFELRSVMTPLRTRLFSLCDALVHSL